MFERVKALVVGILLGVLSLTMFAAPASAFVLYDGDTMSDPNKSWTWNQNSAPWSGEVWSSWGCMIHSLTQMLLKSGAREPGYTPKTMIDEITASGFAWGTNASYYVYTQPNLSKATNGKVNSGNQVGSQGGSPLSNFTYDNIRDGVKSGKQYLFHVTYPGGGVHWMATDFVDSGDTLHIIDSGWNEGQDSSLMKALDTIGTFSKTNPSAYIEFTLSSGEWKTMDPKGGGSSSSDGAKEPADGGGDSTGDAEKMITEDELEGMPDRNDYAATGDLQMPGQGGGWGANDEEGGGSEPDIDPEIQKRVVALQDARSAVVEADRASLLHAGIMLVAIIILLYGVVVLPMAVLFDKANTVMQFSMLGAVTFGKMQLVEDEESRDTLRANKKMKYVTWKNVAVRSGICIAVAVVLLSGLYSDWALKAYYGVGDFVSGLLS